MVPATASASLFPFPPSSLPAAVRPRFAGPRMRCSSADLPPAGFQVPRYEFLPLGRAFAFVVCWFGCALWGHDPGISTAQGELTADRLVLVTGFAPADVEQLLPGDAPRADRWGPGEFEAVQTVLERLAPGLWEASAAGVSLPPLSSSVELLAGDNVSFRVVFTLPPAAPSVVLRATTIPRLPEAHRQFVVITDPQGSLRARKLLSARDPVLEITGLRVPSAPSGTAETSGLTTSAPVAPAGGAFLDFLKLGVEHIWTGYDHLLFLLALLIVCRGVRPMLAIVTCFTVAHSLTLAVATFDWFSLPSRWVEPLIAGSIVFVGAENLLRRGAEPRGRWALTFGFGLIHGFGFASVLRDLGVGQGSGGVLVPLFSFNLGVEAGQIAIALVTLPILWKLRANNTFVRFGVPMISGLTIAAGLFWLLQRTLFA